MGCQAAVPAYSKQTWRRHPDLHPPPPHPDLELAHGGQLLGLQLMCAPPWKAFIGNMPHTLLTADTHTQTHTHYCGFAELGYLTVHRLESLPVIAVAGLKEFKFVASKKRIFLPPNPLLNLTVP